MQGRGMDGKNGYIGNTGWEMAVKTHLVISSDGEPYRIIHLRGEIWASSVDRVGNNHSTLKRVNMKQKGTRSGA